jgi:hypothetical protein
MLPIWGLRAELPARNWAQEKAKPSADPTTTAVKRSGSRTVRQVPWNVFSMIDVLVDEIKRIANSEHLALA